MVKLFHSLLDNDWLPKGPLQLESVGPATRKAGPLVGGHIDGRKATRFVNCEGEAVKLEGDRREAGLS